MFPFRRQLSSKGGAGPSATPQARITSAHAELVVHKVCHVRVEASVDGICSAAMFDLVADPARHTHIFDAIEQCDYELVSDSGDTRVYRIRYMTRWSFWRKGGVAESLLVMTIDRRQRMVSFKLREPGFLLAYEGSWTFADRAGTAAKPAAAGADAAGGGGAGDVGPPPHDQSPAGSPAAQPAGARLVADFSIEPSNQPPYPLNLLLKGQQLHQVEDQIRQLVAAAAEEWAAHLPSAGQAMEGVAAEAELAPQLA